VWNGVEAGTCEAERRHGGGRGGAEPAEKKQRRKKRGMNPGAGL
jgi:hypothetical protein